MSPSSSISPKTKVLDWNDAKDEFGDTWQCSGINERFRLIKYDPGDQFKCHEDGFYQESWDKRSFATLMIYLNDVPAESGGSTLFIDHGIRIHPKQGTCVIFFVDGLRHIGEKLTAGNKYLFRTDLMYDLMLASDLDLKKQIYETMKAAEADFSKEKIESGVLWKKYFKLKEEYQEMSDQLIA